MTRENYQNTFRDCCENDNDDNDGGDKGKKV